jgi:hypothetical protein
MFSAFQGSPERGEQTKTWIDNINEWTDLNVFILLRAAERREQWRTLCDDASVLTPLLPADWVMAL